MEWVDNMVFKGEEVVVWKDRESNLIWFLGIRLGREEMFLLREIWEKSLVVGEIVCFGECIRVEEDLFFFWRVRVFWFIVGGYWEFGLVLSENGVG